MEDTLKISQNEDKSYTVEWNREDPKWSFLNDLTSKEIQVIMEQAIEEFNDGL
jgi:hypothetical protein